MWWVYALGGFIVLVVLGFVGKAFTGASILLKIMLFPFQALIKIIQFIFKK